MLLQLLRELKSGVAAPSANPHKQLSPTSAAQVMSVLSGRIAAVLDGGDCRVGLESTIVDLTQATPQILRSGPITRQQLEDVLGISVLLPDRHDVSVPGNMQVHYQPRAPLFVMTRAHLVQYAKQHASDKLAMLVLGERPLDLQLCHNATVATLPTDKSLYAAALYRSLFEMDSLKPSAILLEQPPTSEEWLDVNDRLSKAATSWQR
jgi:L-threonylcarbamoyladenylate synthase